MFPISLAISPIFCGKPKLDFSPLLSPPISGQRPETFVEGQRGLKTWNFGNFVNSCGFWGTSKQHMKLQQPRNYDFRVSQLNPPRCQSGNDREMTTSPTGHDWEAKIDPQRPPNSSQQLWNDDFCGNVQRPRNATTIKWQVRNCTIAANFAWDFPSPHGCCPFMCLLMAFTIAFKMPCRSAASWMLTF